MWQSAFNAAEAMAGSATASMAGGLAGSIASARQAAKQRDFTKWQMRNRYQLQVADMRDAGLNPALSYGAAAPGPGGGASASIANPVTGSAQARMASAAARKAGAEATITEAQVPGAILKEKVLRDIYEALGEFYNSAKEVSKDPLEALKKYIVDEPNSGKGAAGGVNFDKDPIIKLDPEPRNQKVTPEQFKAWQKRKQRYGR